VVRHDVIGGRARGEPRLTLRFQARQAAEAESPEAPPIGAAAPLGQGGRSPSALRRSPRSIIDATVFWHEPALYADGPWSCISQQRISQPWRAGSLFVSSKPASLWSASRNLSPLPEQSTGV